jgi:hypothetical protein
VTRSSADGLRVLYLTSSFSGMGSEGLRGRSLVENMLDNGCTVRVRHIYVDDKTPYVANNPALADDLTDAKEFETFRPDAVVVEGGLYQVDAAGLGRGVKLAVPPGDAHWAPQDH